MKQNRSIFHPMLIPYFSNSEEKNTHLSCIFDEIRVVVAYLGEENKSIKLTKLA